MEPLAPLRTHPGRGGERVAPPGARAALARRGQHRRLGADGVGGRRRLRVLEVEVVDGEAGLVVLRLGDVGLQDAQLQR